VTSLRRAWTADDALAALENALPGNLVVKSAKQAFDEYVGSSPSLRPAALAKLRELAGDHEAVQVDLALDVTVTLPHTVAREAERAANLLHRLASPHTPRSRAMERYHARFLDRYGLGRAVPLPEVTDPDDGLGFPDGYDADPRRYRPEVEDEARHAVLLDLLMDAALDGRREVVLDEAVIQRLSRPGGRPPASVDLFCTVVARDDSALRNGDFELIVSSLTGTQQAGASLGRFGHLPGADAALRHLLAAGRREDDPRLAVELSHAAIPRRYGNLLPSIRTLPDALLIGVPPMSERDLRLNDVALVADSDRLRLHSLSRDRELAVIVPHVLDTDTVAPAFVRLVRDVSFMGLRTFKGWSWGTLAGAPFLPAVRHGRTVLSPARWRARPEDVADDAALGAWRARLRVPRHVRLAHGDQRISLDLDSTVHRNLLRSAARSAAVDLNDEPLPDSGDGWLRGPGGVYEGELVLSLFSTPEAPPPPRHGPVLAHVPTALPGGDWLYARLPCDTPRQHQVLTRHLLPWITAMGGDVGRWFFLRYADERGAPELRLRLHGTSDRLYGSVLATLRDLVAGLTEQGLSGPLTLAPYHPEVGRYGGPALMPMAERVFTADSRLVLHRLLGADDEVAAARDVVKLVLSFHDGEDGLRWILSHFPYGYAERRMFAGRRAAAVAAIRPATTDAGDAVERDWARSLTGYGQQLAVAEADADTALAALVHMHCNRRLGPDLAAERLVYALAAGALRAHEARARAPR
jgi:thiopeptide-type bacteriocin biosynthesis protein